QPAMAPNRTRTPITTQTHQGAFHTAIAITGIKERTARPVPNTRYAGCNRCSATTLDGPASRVRSEGSDVVGELIIGELGEIGDPGPDGLGLITIQVGQSDGAGRRVDVQGGNPEPVGDRAVVGTKVLHPVHGHDGAGADVQTVRDVDLGRGD